MSVSYYIDFIISNTYVAKPRFCQSLLWGSCGLRQIFLRHPSNSGRSFFRAIAGDVLIWMDIGSRTHTELKKAQKRPRKSPKSAFLAKFFLKRQNFSKLLQTVCKLVNFWRTLDKGVKWRIFYTNSQGEFWHKIYAEANNDDGRRNAQNFYKFCPMYYNMWKI